MKIKTSDGNHIVLAVGSDKTGTFVMVENTENLATIWHRTQLPEPSRRVLDKLVSGASGYKITLGGSVVAFLNAV